MFLIKNSVRVDKKYFYILLIIQVIALSISFYFIQQDDAYIFYKYAKNIAEGNGYVFNAGEKINATTSFFYTIVLSIVYYLLNFNPEILFPLTGNLIGIFSLIFLTFFLMKCLENDLGDLKFLLPLILFTIPFLKSAVGMETFLKLFLILVTIYSLQNERYIITGVLSGILILTRPDTIIFVAILVLHTLLRKKNRYFLNLIIPSLSISLIYLIFNRFYFGNVIPSSLKVKIFQSESGLIKGNYLSGFIYSIPGGIFPGTLFYIVLILCLIYLIKIKSSIFKNLTFKILAIYLSIQFLIYSFILNPPPYQWYYIDYILIYVPVFAYTLGSLIQKFSSRKQEIFVYLATLVIFLLSLLIPFRTIKNGFSEKFLLYKNISIFLNYFSDRNSTLATDEIGILGFYFKGKIIDELGLITPSALENLRENNLLRTIKITEPDYVILDYPTVPHYKDYVKSNWFNQKYLRFYSLTYPHSGISIYKIKEKVFNSH